MDKHHFSMHCFGSKFRILNSTETVLFLSKSRDHTPLIPALWSQRRAPETHTHTHTRTPSSRACRKVLRSLFWCYNSVCHKGEELSTSRLANELVESFQCCVDIMEWGCFLFVVAVLCPAGLKPLTILLHLSLKSWGCSFEPPSLAGMHL